ncbi:MAG: universal stress protein [Betaproteobacteria bacterium]|nr:universal stress protein [Betaproteobacteria bacterium]
MKRILAATDFSELGNAAALRAAQLALQHGAELRCLHAAPSEVALRSIFADVTDSFVDDFRVATRKQADSFGHTLHGVRGQPVAVECLDGSPHRVMLEAAEDWGADLLVAGAHGQGALEQLFLGGTISKMMAGAECPLLIVRKAQQGAYGNVLAAIDLQARSKDVLLAALSMTPGKIEVFHAIQPPLQQRMRMYGVSDDIVSRMTSQHREHVAAVVKNLIASVPGADRLIPRTGEGHPNSAILEALGARRADLLVIGKHGGRRFAERVMGSVPKFLAYNASCDILIV